jgi:hypothetical protein
MLANEKLNFNKIWAGADPMMGIRTIFGVEWYCDWGIGCVQPVSFEFFSP